MSKAETRKSEEPPPPPVESPIQAAGSSGSKKTNPPNKASPASGAAETNASEAARTLAGTPYNQQAFAGTQFAHNPQLLDSPSFMHPPAGRFHRDGGMMHHNVNAEGLAAPLSTLRTPELVTLIDNSVFANANVFNGYRNSPSAHYMPNMNGTAPMASSASQQPYGNVASHTMMSREEMAAAALVSHSQNSPHIQNQIHGMRSQEDNPFAASFASKSRAIKPDPRSQEDNPFAASFGAKTTKKSGARATDSRSKAKQKSSLSNKRGATDGPKPPKKRRGSANNESSKAPSAADKKTLDRRERNRIAAANCRQRKIDKENLLREKLKVLKDRHGDLLQELRRAEKHLKIAKDSELAK